MGNTASPNNDQTTQPAQSNSQQLSPPTAQTLLTPKRKNWLIMGMSVLLLFLFGTTVFLAYQNYQMKKQGLQAQPVGQPTQVLLPTQAVSKKLMGEEECNPSQTYCVNREYADVGSGKETVSLILIPEDSQEELLVLDKYPFITKITHRFFINDSQIIYSISDNEGLLKTIIYDINENQKTELETSDLKRLFDITNNGWFIYFKPINETKQYWMEKNGEIINLGITPGGMNGISPSGKYGTLINHFPARTTEGIGKNKVAGYESFSVFPIEEGGIEKAVYLGDFPYYIAGITQPVDRPYSVWSNNEIRVKCNGFLVSSDFFPNPLAE